MSTTQQQPNQTANSQWLRILLPLIILAGGGVAGYLLILMAPSPEQKPEKGSLIEAVRTEPAKKLEGELQLEADGTVVPHRVIDLAAEVSGMIVWKNEHCRTGRFIQKGDEICKIDPQDYDIAKRQLEQQLEQTDANINEIKIDIKLTGKLIELEKKNLDLLEKEHNRMIELGKTDAVSDSQIETALRGVIQSQNALLSLEKQIDTMNAKLSSLDEGRDLIEVQLEKAIIDLKRATVRSPVSGVVVTDMIESGDFVNRGTPLVSIEDTSAVEVRCYLRIDQLKWLWGRKVNQSEAEATSTEVETPEATSASPSTNDNGQPSTSTPEVESRSWTEIPEPTEATPENDEETESTPEIVDYSESYEIPPMPVDVVFSLPGREYVWRGKLSRYEGIGLDPKTRTMPVRILIENPRMVETIESDGRRSLGSFQPPALIRDMFVVVRIKIETNIPLFKVPEESLRPGNPKIIWIVRDEKLRKVPIEVIETLGKTIIVRALDNSLVDSDPVVVSPLSFPHDGIPVEIHNNKDKTKDEQNSDQKTNDLTDPSKPDEPADEETSTDSL